MGVALPILGIASGAASAVGKIMEGNARSESDLYASQVAANNAKTAAQNAAWTIESGDIASGNESRKTAALIGHQKAAQGANNIDVNSGSAVDVRSSTAALGMLDALTIRSDAARRAYGYQVQQQNFETEAAAKRASAKYAKTAGWLGAGGSLLSTASTVGKDFSAWQQGSGASPAAGSSSPGTPMNLVPTFGADNNFVSDDFSGVFA